MTMDFSDLLEVLAEIDAETKPPTYTFPDSAFAEPQTPDDEGPCVVPMAKTMGALAVVEDPATDALWQVVHKPSGRWMARGTQADMCKALDKFMTMPVDWETVLSNVDEFRPFLDQAKAIRDMFADKPKAAPKAPKPKTDPKAPKAPRKPKPEPRTYPPRFMYVKTVNDTIPVSIDGYRDRDLLMGYAKLSDGKERIYAWLKEFGELVDDLPSQEVIVGIDLELHDNPKDALAGGNATVDIWV